MSAPALEAEALTVSLAKGAPPALAAVDLAVRPGRLTGVLGRNGAGKSTLARALAGLVAPTSGHARIGGAEASRLPRREAARRVAYLPQETPADLPFTAAEAVLLGRAPHLGALGLDSASDRALARDALARVDALPFADRPLAELSGGERRRVLLARVLVQEAPAWILDEPTAHLDLAHQALVAALCRERAVTGGAVLSVLHELGAAAACDELVVLDAGRVAARGAPEAVLRPEVLGPILGVPLVAAAHPETGRPLLVPR